MPHRHLDIVHVFAPGRTGGLERVVEMLAGGQATQGHHVTAIGIAAGDLDESPVMQRLEAAGVAVSTLRVSGRAYGRERQSVAHALEKLPRGIVHTHGYRADVLHASTAAKLGFATTTTLHGFTGGDLKNRAYETLQRRACRAIDRVVGVSRPIVERMRRDGVDASRLRLIPNAYGIAENQCSRLEARERLGLPREGFVVGWVGRLTREKGADVLVSAMTHLRDLPILVAVVGEGVEAGPLREQAERQGVGHLLHWTGAIDGVSCLFGAFDALVLSSRTEGTPIVLFEAMSAGVPIVATAVGGVPDVLTSAEAVLVPAEVPEKLAEGIRTLVERPLDAEARAQNASAVLHDRFAPGPWLDRYEVVYKEALSRGRGRSS